MGDSSDDEGVEMRREAVQEEDNDGDSDEEEQPAGKAAASDDEDDDDDDDDDSSDEEEEERQRGKKRRKNDGSKYLDMEAGEEEDSDDEDEGHSRQRKRGRHEDDEDEELDDDTAGQLMEKAVHQRRRGPDFLHDDNVSENFFQDRYRVRDDDDEDEMDTDAKQNARLPDAKKDPAVWSVKVANGQEQSLVIQLLKKCCDMAAAGTPLHVSSVYCNGQVQGFIYIEARKQAFVKEALNGIRGIYHTKMHLIPIKEMVATVTVSKVNATAMAKGWARCKRGKYKGDIVQIISVDNNKNEIEVRMVPRVDTTDYSQFDESEAKKRRAKFVPSRRLFKPEDYSTDDLLKWGIERIRDEDLENVYVYQGMKFETFAGDSDSSTGFLRNRWPVKSLQIGSEVVPQLDELKLFEQATEEQEGAGSSFQHLTNVHKRKIVLQKGDIVRVKEGELRDLLGLVDAVNKDTVIIKARHEAIKDKLSFKLSEVEKYFDQGDHVKVVGGRKAGVTGTVVRVEGEVIYLLTDITNDEIRVFSADLQETNEVSSGLDVVGQFRLYDLVLLESAGVSMTMPSVGVIIKLERDALQILDNNNKIQAKRPSDVTLHRKSATAVALDSEQQTIGQGDAIKCIDGQFKGKSGTVRHVFRAFLFIYSPTRLEQSGMFCVRSRHCTLMGQSKHTENAPTNMLGGGMIPGRGAPGRGMIPGPPPDMMGGGRGRGRGAGWEGKRVRIMKGFDRNKIGTVKEETETVCRVELDANHKRVAVKKSDIQELGQEARYQGNRRPDSSSEGMFHSAGAQSPAWTPSTPGFEPSTPSHDPAGTPSTPRQNYFDAASTPADEAYGTPATPGAAYGQSPYDQPAQTPATPAAYGGYGYTPSGSTPHDAHTPHTPMTPGGWNQSGFGGGHPGSVNAQTPWDNATPATPATPGSELGGSGAGRSAPQTKNWCIKNIEVRVVSGEFIDKTGIVVELIGSETKVKLESGAFTTVPAEDLEAVPPQKNSSVIILQGDLSGHTGKLIGIDGRDGIVKMDKNSDIKIVDMPWLAVHSPPA